MQTYFVSDHFKDKIHKSQLNKTKDIIFTEDVRTMSFVGDHFKYKIHKWRIILLSLLNQVLAKEKCTKRTWIIINEKSQVKHHNITALILSQDELISYTNLLHLFVLKRCSLYRSTFQCYIQDVDHSHSNQFMLMWMTLGYTLCISFITAVQKKLQSNHLLM